MDNEKNVEECKCKQICSKMSKMQNDSLRYAIDFLKNNQNNSYAIKKTLKSICKLLEVYSCLPCTCLLTRVKYTNKKIEASSGGLFKSEKIILEMLIIELEAFLSNS